MSETDTRRQRRGGRERRDPNAKPAAPPYITRAIPTYDIMSEENLQKIEAASDRILAEVGLDIRDDDECLAMFKKSGARVDGMRVRFEPGTCANCSRRRRVSSSSMRAIRHDRSASVATAWCSRRPTARRS